MLYAICGVLIMTLASGIFYIFFRGFGKPEWSRDDIRGKSRDPGFTPSSGYIDRITSSGLFILLCTLWKGEFINFSMKAKLGPGVLFVAGMVTFITTASFGTDPLGRPTGIEPLFMIVALFPNAGYFGC